MPGRAAGLLTLAAHQRHDGLTASFRAQRMKRRYRSGGGMKFFVAAAALLCSLPAFAGVNSAIFFQVPTLDEFGLIGLVVAVGVAAGLVIRRKKK